MTRLVFEVDKKHRFNDLKSAKRFAWENKSRFVSVIVFDKRGYGIYASIVWCRPDLYYRGEDMSGRGTTLRQRLKAGLRTAYAYANS